MDRLTFSLAALAVASTGCINIDVCADGYTRVEGRCVRPGDGGTADGSGTIDSCRPVTFYRDGDEDTFGDDTDTMSACDAPTGYVTTAGDCDDTVDTIHPDAPEACNQTDDDCDVAVDEGLIGALGAPIPMGAGDGGGGVVALDDYDIGYVAVWADALHVLQYALLTTIGGEVVSPRSLAPSIDGANQYEPHVRVVHAPDAEYAVVAWNEGRDRIRATVIPLDGRPVLEPVLLEEDTTDFANVGNPGVAEIGSHAAVAWFNFPTNQVHAARIDATTGTVVTSARAVYSFTMNGQLLGYPMLTTVGPDTLVLGSIDQRTGDSAYTGYLTTLSSELTAIGEPVRVRPDPTMVVFQLAADTEPAGETTLAAVTTPGGTTNFFYTSLTTEGGITTLGEDARTIAGNGLVLGYAGAPGGLLVTHALIADDPPTLDLWVTELLQTSAGGARSVPIAAADAYTGAAIARHSTGAIAVLYGAYMDGTGESEIFVQRLGCE